MILSTDRIQRLLTRVRRRLRPFSPGLGARRQTPSARALRGVALAGAAGALVLGIGGPAQAQDVAAVEAHLNQIAAAGGVPPELAQLLTELGAPGPITATAEVAQALSPEPYDAQTTVAVESGRLVAHLLFDRLRECKEGEFEPWLGRDRPILCHSHQVAPWVAATGSFRSRDAFSGHPEYDAQFGGIVAGVDARPIPGIDVSLVALAQRGAIEVDNADSTMTLVGLMGHAAWTRGRFRAQGAFGWAHGFHRDRRTIRFSSAVTPVNVRGKDDHESDTVSIAAEVGMQLVVGPFKVEPLFGLDWAWVYQDEISESEAGAFGIRIDSRDDEIGSVTGGVRATTVFQNSRRGPRRFSWTEGIWTPQVDLRWRQIVEGDEREIKGRLLGGAAGVPDFTVQGEEDAGGVEIGAGLSFVPEKANRLQFEIRYEAFVASNTLQQNVTARIALGF